MFTKYYKKKKNQPPKGCLVVVDAGDAVENEPSVVIGASICADGDQFSYKVARDIAVGRAQKALKDVKYEHPLVKRVSLADFEDDDLQFFLKKVNLTHAGGAYAIKVPSITDKD